MAPVLDDIVSAVDAEVCGPWRGVAVRGVSTDTRTLQPGELYVALAGENFDGRRFVREAAARGASACLLAGDLDAVLPIPVLRVDDAARALGALAAWHRQQLPATVIAITGSNGKTTTKSMLAHVLSRTRRTRAAVRSFNNHIGVPLTLLSGRPNDEFLIVEIGSNAPGEVAALARLAAPDVGVVTSIGHAHLEGFGGLDGVRREKLSLFDEVRPNGWGLIDAEVADGLGVLPRAGELRWLTFGAHPDADVRVTDFSGDLHGVEASIDGGHRLQLGVPGVHNAVNACAVFALCRQLGLAAAEILAGLSTFTMPAMRLNVRRCGEVTLIDDCYNANPTSMSAALDVLQRAPGRRVFVAGAMAEVGQQSEACHRALGEEAIRAGVAVLIAVGPDARPVQAAAAETGVRALWVTDAEAAAPLLAREIQRGDTVLIKGSRAAGLEVLADRLEASETTARGA